MHWRLLKYTLGTIAAVAVTLTLACSSNNSNPSPTTPSPTPTPGPSGAADVTLNIVGLAGSNSFSPNPGTIRVGQTLAWKNTDQITHTATGDAGGFNTGNVASGATSAPITMSTAGTFTYHCAIHPSMTGTLTVTQ